MDLLPPVDVGGAVVGDLVLGPVSAEEKGCQCSATESYLSSASLRRESVPGPSQSRPGQPGDLVPAAAAHLVLAMTCSVPEKVP